MTLIILTSHRYSQHTLAEESHLKCHSLSCRPSSVDKDVVVHTHWDSVSVSVPPSVSPSHVYSRHSQLDGHSRRPYDPSDAHRQNRTPTTKTRNSPPRP